MNSDLEKLEARIKELVSKMTELAPDVYPSAPDYDKAKADEYYKIIKEYQDLREKYNNMLDAKAGIVKNGLIKSDDDNSGLIEALIRKGYSYADAVAQAQQLQPQTSSTHKIVSAEGDPDDMGGEDVKAIDDSDIDDDFVDDVNSDDGFSDSDVKLSKDDVVKAVEAIDAIADVVVNTEGVDKDDITPEEQEYILDTVDDIAEAPEGGAEGDTAAEDLPDIPDDINNSRVRVYAVTSAKAKKAKKAKMPKAKKAKKGKRVKSSITEESIEGIGKAVICTNSFINSDMAESDGYTDEADTDNIGDDSQVVVNDGTPEDSDDTDVTIKAMTLESAWKDKSPEHMKAWKVALDKVKDQLGKDPETPKEWATVCIIAKNYYNKYFGNAEAKEALSASFKNVPVVLKVLKARYIKNGKKLYSAMAAVEGATPPTPQTVDKKGQGYKVVGLQGNGSTRKEDNGGAIEDESGGTIEGTTSVGEPFNDTGFNFDATKIAALKVPVENEDKSVTVRMAEVSSGVYVAKDAKIESSKDKSVVFSAYKDDPKDNFSLEGLDSIYTRLNGKVISLKSSGKALILKNSPILGLVAVKADFMRGINNSKYSLFSSKNGRLVSSDGLEIESSSNRVIASPVSNKAIKKSDLSRDMFMELESSYVGYLKDQVKAGKEKLESSVKKLNEENKVLNKRIALKEGMIKDLQNKVKEVQIKSSASLDDFKKSVAEKEAQALMNANQKRLAKEEEERTRRVNSVADRLAKWMI